MKPQLSVITICLNAREALRATIDSVNSQTYPDIEHIIIDGGSSDSTVEVIQNLARRDAKWVSERDRGISDAFNKGTAMASGSYFCYLNAGDAFVSADLLERVANLIAIDRPEQPTIYFGDFLSVSHGIERMHYTSSIHEAFAWANPINHQSAFIPRRLAQAHSYDTRLQLGMDYDFWLRVASQSKFKKMDFAVASFALDGRSSTSAWVVHNLVIRRALWHINRRSRVEISDLIVLIYKAAFLRARFALKDLLGAKLNKFIRRSKLSGLRRIAPTSSGLVAKPADQKLLFSTPSSIEASVSNDRSAVSRRRQSGP